MKGLASSDLASRVAPACKLLRGGGKTYFPPETYKRPLFSLHKGDHSSPAVAVRLVFTQGADKAHVCMSKLRTLKQAETSELTLLLTYVRHRFEVTGIFRAGPRWKHHVL